MRYLTETTPRTPMNNYIDDPRILHGMQKQLILRRERLNAGEKHIGWKVGFGAPASLERLQLTRPLIGFLTDRIILPSNAAVSLAGWTKPAMEPEVAVYLGSDLPGGSDRETTRASIAALGPAIELADVHFPPDDVQAILAGNIYNRHVILGRADTSRATCVLAGLVGRVARNAKDLPPVTELQSITGGFVELVTHVADTLSMFGETLRAGDVIITGSLLPPLWVEAGESIEYTLEPVDSLSINFA